MDFGITDFRKKFNKSLPWGENISPKEYKLVIELYSKKVIDEIIFNNYNYKIPRLLTLLIVKQKMLYNKAKTIKGAVLLPINRVESKKYGKRMYHENEHTDGFIFSFSTIRGMTKNMGYYVFKPERYHAKRYLAKVLNNKSKYGVIEAPIKRR